MTTLELLALCRLKLDDQVEPYRVSDEDIIDALARAQEQFARLTLSVYGAESTSPITADAPWVELPANLLVLKAIIHNGRQVRPVLIHEMDLGYAKVTNAGQNTGHWSDWRSAVGTPKFAITDMGPGKARLVPMPDAAAVAADANPSIEGYVVPPMMTDLVDPQIPEPYHAHLVHGALVKLYDIDDVDVGDQDLKARASADWQRSVREAQMHLNTELRALVRKMRLPRGFEFNNIAGAPVVDQQPGQ